MAGKIFINYHDLINYCKTERQQRVIQGIIEHGGRKPLAEAEGEPLSTIANIVKTVQTYQARGEIGLPTLIPDGYKLKGTSTYFGADGQLKGQWVKTDQDKARQEEILKAWIKEMGQAIESYKPMKRVKCPRGTLKDLIAEYPLGDPHLGMYAWAAETGQDFDCDIAESNLKDAMGYLVSKMPDAETAVILNLGDFFHTDNLPSSCFYQCRFNPCFGFN